MIPGADAHIGPAVSLINIQRVDVGIDPYGMALFCPKE